MFYNKLKELCEKEGISVTNLVVSLGISKSNVTNWKNGVSPNLNILKEISERFSVSIDYLLGSEKIDYEITALHRIFDLCKRKGIEHRKMLIDLKIDNYSYTQWVQQSIQPSEEHLTKIADYFGVTTDYLLGREKEPTLDDQLRDVLFAASGGDTKEFSEEQKWDILNFVNYIKSQKKGQDTK